MSTCVNHPDRKALSTCHGCGKPYCEACLVEGNEYYYCKSHSCQELLKKEIPSESLLPSLIECPHCHSELRLSGHEQKSRKIHCPDCEAFVDFTIDPPMILERKDYTEVFSSMNLGDIGVLKSILDDNDIDYYVFGEDFLATYPMVEPAKFFVLNDQVNEARDILKTFNANAFALSRRKGLPE